MEGEQTSCDALEKNLLPYIFKCFFVILYLNKIMKNIFLCLRELGERIISIEDTERLLLLNRVAVKFSTVECMFPACLFVASRLSAGLVACSNDKWILMNVEGIQLE